MAKSGKGSAFERWIAKTLSLWFTQDWPEPRQDIFWRTAGSGARATTRAKKNLETTNSSGDLMALDPIGLPYLKVFCTELKNGYNRFSIADLLDKPKGGALQMYEKWFIKAIRDQERCGSLYWMLIVKRDHRETIIFLPTEVVEKIKLSNYVLADFYFTTQISCIHLSLFLEKAQPDNIKALVR